MPERLPDGEFLLWQGRPAWWPLAVRALHFRAVAVYFAVLLIWRVGTGLSDGFSLAGSTKNTMWLLVLSLVVLSALALLAWLYSKTTVYSITNRRLVMHIGAALPVALNLPFSKIGAVSARTYRDGTSDIPLLLLSDDRVAYLHLWPHVRPWRLRTPEPMLRCVADGERVASLLARELTAAQPEHAVALCPDDKGESMRAHAAPAAA
jgi:hypothetical protein